MVTGTGKVISKVAVNKSDFESKRTLTHTHTHTHTMYFIEVYFTHNNM